MHPERRPNAGRSPESLEARLRALPQPPVPADLEARLLATIPAAILIPQRRWGVWVGALGALAAACLVVVLAWPGRDDKNLVVEMRVFVDRDGDVRQAMILGSQNMNEQSWQTSRELSVLIDDPKTTASFDAAFQAVWDRGACAYECGGCD